MRRILLNTASVLLAASTAVAATSVAVAQEAPAISGNVALVSDYRFRGVSLSDETIAVQGGFDLVTEPGFYVGTWGSSIDQVGGEGELELDLYGGYRTELGMFTLDGGVLGYFYPGADDLEYYEVYGKASTSLGAVGLTGGINFAPEQENLFDDDNIYYFLDGAMPIGDSPFSLTGHVGYEDGVLAAAFDDNGEESKTDWSLGIGTNALGIDWGLAYVDTTEDGDDTEGTAVLTLKKTL